MADDKVHRPSLPGVKTYAKDIEGNADPEMGVSFDDPKSALGKSGKIHEPERTGAAPGHYTKNSILTNKDDVFDVSHAFESGTGFGTIITDKKENHTKFGSILSKAFDEWFGGIKRKIEKIEIFEEEETPTMSPVEQRREVISEAGRHTRQAPKDDHLVVVEKLKTLKHDTEKITKQPILVKEKTDVPTPMWTHNVGETMNEALNEDTHIAKVAKDIRGVHDFRDTTGEPVSKSETPRQPIRHIDPKMGFEETIRGGAEAKPKMPPVEGVFKGATSSVLSTETKRHIETAQQQKVEQKKTEHAEPEDHFAIVKRSAGGERGAKAPETQKGAGVVISNEDFFSFPETKTETGRAAAPLFESTPLEKVDREVVHETIAGSGEDAVIREKTFLSRLRTYVHVHKVHVVVLCVVVIIGGTLGTAAALYLDQPSPISEEIPTETTIPSYFTVDAQVPVRLERDHDVFMDTLNGALLRTQERAVQIYPILSNLDDPKVLLARTGNIFNTIAPNANSAFIRALEEGAMLGSITTNTKEPFIMVQTNNFDAAFAGMLDWEPSMAEDLLPFFDTRTLIEESTGTETTQNVGRFLDATRQGMSVRILYDSAGTERIVYAFVARDTLVITESTAALAALIERLR